MSFDLAVCFQSHKRITLLSTSYMLYVTVVNEIIFIAYRAFFCPNHTLMLPTFSLSSDRRGKRQIARETGGQANPCMPSAPFNFLSLFHSILCAPAPSDKPSNSLTHSSLLFSFVRPVQLCAPLFIPQTAHH